VISTLYEHEVSDALRELLVKVMTEADFHQEWKDEGYLLGELKSTSSSGWVLSAFLRFEVLSIPINDHI